LLVVFTASMDFFRKFHEGKWLWCGGGITIVGQFVYLFLFV
jgi:hypothetical protein